MGGSDHSVAFNCSDFSAGCDGWQHWSPSARSRDFLFARRSPSRFRHGPRCFSSLARSRSARTAVWAWTRYPV